MAAPIAHETARRGREAASAVAQPARPWLVRGARLGYAASGLVYATLGILTLQAVFGGGRTEDSRGAITTLAEQPAGQLLVGLVALGLLAYAAWRLVEAATDAEGKGSEPKGLAVRAMHAASGLLYGALGLFAFRLLTGSGARQGSGPGWTARLMALPSGRWLVGLAGLGVIGYGLYQLYRAATAHLDRQLDLSRVDADQRQWIVRASRAGIGARGVVLAIIGGLLVRGALRYDAARDTGVDAALATLAGAPFGRLLLALVAIGFLGYALYQIVRARYRRVAL